MSKLYFLLLLLFPTSIWSQRFQLAPPQIRVDSIFFRQNAKVEIAFDLEGAVIHYTTTGGYPSDNTPVYEKPLTVQTTGPIRAKARHPEYLNSLLAEQRVMKVSHVPDSVSLIPLPDSLYPGQMTRSVFDLQKGSRDLKDGRWMGFRGDTVVLEAYFKQPVTCRVVILSTLVDADYWIFPPDRIEVYGASGDKPWQYMGTRIGRDIPANKKPLADYSLFQKVLLRPASVERIQVRILPFGNLPSWHSGAGTPAWLFIDELVFE